MKRLSNESYADFAVRATHAVEDGLIDYAEWSESLIGAVRYGDENLRRAFNLAKQIIDNIDNDDVGVAYSGDKQAQIDELRNERIKLQTANLEYSKNQRDTARQELFNEQIRDAIDRLEPFEAHDYIKTQKSGASALLLLSDFHAGATYEIKGLYNEVVNKYDFETMQNRLWNLLAQMEADDIEQCDDLTIGIVGDAFENVLRVGSLTNLKEPVVDTVIKFSEFMATWIFEAYKKFKMPINVVTVGGNHDVIRMLQSKPAFEGENLTKIVVEFLKLRLADCMYITVDDYTDCAIKTIKRNNIMIEHGQGDIVATMDYYSNLYSVDIDEGFFGHLHSQSSKPAGITDVGDRMAYRVGSICGVDSYAKKLRKSARPSATFVTYTENGRDWSKTYYLG